MEKYKPNMPYAIGSYPMTTPMPETMSPREKVAAAIVKAIRDYEDHPSVEPSVALGDVKSKAAAAILAALSPEAPAREGVDLQAIAKDAAERVHKNGGCVPQMAYAPILFALQDALTPRHEAPAEGAGEFARQMEILRKAASVPVPDDDNDFTVEKARRGSESWRVIAANVLREYDRARSSAPEAREGELAGYANAEFMRRLKNWREAVPNTIRSDETFLKAVASESYPVALYTHPAAPSADKLRIAVEALGLTKSRIQTWPIDDQETCMCGSPVSGHGMGDGHSPVSQGDHAVSMLVEEIDQALAALKAEIAK